MSDGLVAFLRDCLDEDEQEALNWPHDQRQWRVAGRRMLTYDNGATEDVTAVDVKDGFAEVWERVQVKRGPADLATHIARHDPARVLAEVEAKRRIVDGYEDALRVAVVTAPAGPLDDMVKYTGTALMFAVQCLAAPYADRPGYQPEWRP